MKNFLITFLSECHLPIIFSFIYEFMLTALLFGSVIFHVPGHKRRHSPVAKPPSIIDVPTPSPAVSVEYPVPTPEVEPALSPVEPPLVPPPSSVISPSISPVVPSATHLPFRCLLLKHLHRQIVLVSVGLVIFGAFLVALIA